MKMKTTFIIFIIISNILFASVTFANEKSLDLANQVNTRASLDLAWKYFNGEGVDQDYEKAYIWFKKAADSGDAKATWEVAKMYGYGVGIAQNSKKGNAWFEKAFVRFEEAGLQGDGHASRKVAEMYQWGVTVDWNIDKAVFWFERAGEQGDVLALMGLAYIITYGIGGLTYDIEKGNRWYKKAAELGNAKAMFIMGTRYFYGRDLIQDYGKAHYWYIKAAEQGDAWAHGNLGEMFEKGLGVTKNYSTALKHYYLSEYLGMWSTSILQYIKSIESEMTSAEIARAKQLADGWLKAHNQVRILNTRCNKLKTLIKNVSKTEAANMGFTHQEFARGIGCWWAN
ncbi:MAG: sel1 repeat family protein [Rhizobiales bacterium]|nr:sel1 repeat family protein [Hyphomicrobiales bacterium]NRB13121.1 sel1 repeat family protein [Hyphomicrobiales bacterium]